MEVEVKDSFSLRIFIETPHTVSFYVKNIEGNFWTIKFQIQEDREGSVANVVKLFKPSLTKLVCLTMANILTVWEPGIQSGPSQRCNDTQHEGRACSTQHNDALYLMTLC
jgi:hypothetical protein